ncbi:hypothetical protein FCK90_09395 [Kocuria coralli]|uniref:Uncharacterized protein n=1 Tax=Kocuria coralli TaxID=1461025 RepID=A0A5J5KYB2_9MICC|nr:hypothetical protein [Kocuria coralli]KAA9393875.1 hypothetical protein FCK90_09395 [Kocuria coralli]
MNGRNTRARPAILGLGVGCLIAIALNLGLWALGVSWASFNQQSILVPLGIFAIGSLLVLIGGRFGQKNTGKDPD